MTWQQFLTEKVLGECWHAFTFNDFGYKVCKCNGKPWIFGDSNERIDLHTNRTFDNRNDMMGLYQKVYEDGKWKEFTEYAFRFYKEDYSEEQFNTWLFCPKGKDPEVLYRCFIVSAWLEVNDSVVSPIIVNGRSVSLEEGK